MLKKFKNNFLVLFFTTISCYAYTDNFDTQINSENQICYTPLSNCCFTSFFQMDALCLVPIENGLDECFSSENEDIINYYDGNVISRSKIKRTSPNFDWNAGFRVGAGYTFFNCWDLGIYWTHFHSHAVKNDSNNYCNINRSIKWKINFEIIDFIASRSFDFCSCLTVQPFGGLRVLDNEQKVHLKNDASYVNQLFSYASIYNTETKQLFYAHKKQKFLGVGPILGIEGNWQVLNDYHLYADVALSFLYGNFHIQSASNQAFSDGLNIEKEESKRHACQTVLDVGLGIRWQTCCFGYNGWLQLGLEHHSYFDQNQFNQHGDLSLNGLNLSLYLSF